MTMIFPVHAGRLGAIASQSPGSVAITGGTITGITDLAVADGGTGASTAASARTNLGLGTLATQDANNVAVTGGTLTATDVGQHPGYVTNRYYGLARASGITTANLSANTMYASPILIGKTHTFISIGVYVTSASGVNGRFGIYDTSNGAPGSLVLDAGATALSTAALAEKTISQSLTPGWYWLVILTDGSATVNGGSSTSPGQGFALGFADGNSEGSRMTKAQAYGALPGTFGSPTYSAGGSSLPLLLLKA